MKNNTKPSVAIILVNWNGYAYTRICLQSLFKIEYTSFKVFVVDNGSTDGFISTLKAEHPTVTFIESQKNLGFTGGNNLGVEEALSQEFDFILLLNNDTEVSPDFLSQLVLTYESNPHSGIIQPLILFNRDRDTIWSAGGRFQYWLGRSKTIADRMSIGEFSKNKPYKIDWATGCCMLIPRSVFKKVGLLNDSFFAYYEDVDFSLNVTKKGYDITLDPNSIIYHEAGAASKKQSSEGQLSPTVFYLNARNQIFQLRLHIGFPHFLIAFTYQIIKFSMWITYFCLRLRFKKVKAVFLGLYDGFKLDPKSKTLYPPR